jgi:hypothetical protein
MYLTIASFHPQGFYSWDTDKGGMSQKTEMVKSHSGVLKNPLGDFDEHLTLVDEMMQSLDTLIEDEGDGAITAVIQSLCN